MYVDCAHLVCVVTLSMWWGTVLNIWAGTMPTRSPENVCILWVFTVRMVRGGKCFYWSVVDCAHRAGGDCGHRVHETGECIGE